MLQYNHPTFLFIGFHDVRNIMRDGTKNLHSMNDTQLKWLEYLKKLSYLVENDPWFGRLTPTPENVEQVKEKF